MDAERRDELIAVYRDGLLEDVLPFWIRHSVDREHGGFHFCLDRDGTLIDSDKGMWQQSRFVWLLATLHDTVEPRDEWLELARHGIEFIRRAGFDSDGRMFFHVTRDGRPIRKRRYVLTEAFAAMAFAAYAKAAQDDESRERALELYDLVVRHMTTPGMIAPKFEDTRPTKGLATPMILITMSQIVGAATGEPRCREWIDRSIDEIERDFMKPDLEAVMETVGPEGEVLDHLDGRMLNPGHAIEAGWFVLDEARLRGGDERLLAIGTRIVDWAWRRGWDEEHGGLLYFVDLKGLPVQEYWHDMKFWWPQNEAVIANLMAYQATGDETFAERHRLAHDWAHTHFPDPEFGEWYGYLHRDGRVSQPAKGNLWKGPFHVPRMQWKCWQLLQDRGGATA